MNKIQITSKYILIISFLILNSVSAQWRLSLATTQEYSNNPFNSPIESPSMVSSINLGIEKDFSALSIGYYGNYTNFFDISERNFFWHQVGLWNLTDSTIYGIYFEQRGNTKNYESYNYSNLSSYYKQNFTFNSFNVLGNIALSYTDYPYLIDLRNILLNTGLMLNKSFETKTTLIGGVSFNYKNYISSDLNSNELVGDSMQSSSSHAFTSQLSSYLRLAQSITENTGLAIQYTNQTILGGTANFIRELDYIYGDESQYFDDPISYQGNKVSAQLTQMISETMILKLNYSYASKEYPSQAKYETPDIYDASSLRLDKKTDINLSFAKYFYFGNEEQNALLVSLSYNFTDNNSNSYWYNYKTNEVSLTINFQF